MDFKTESAFNQEQYETFLRRLHYDDRDAVMYENMLGFLWDYIIQFDVITDREGLLEEYTRWNMQMIDKCFYHKPHDLPYANIRRAYQTLIHLFDGDVEAGLDQLSRIGKEAFMTDGRAPKLHMTKQGKVYKPQSRLFLIYNYDKVLQKKDSHLAEQLRAEYPYPFRTFEDEHHALHDQFLKQQLEKYGDVIFYPEYERVYRIRGGASEFFLYFDEEKGIPIDKIV